MESRFSVRLALAKMVGEPQLEAAGPEDQLVDLGLDSISLVAFALKLEDELGSPLSDQQIAELRDATLGGLDELVESWADRPVTGAGSTRSNPEAGVFLAGQSPHPGDERAMRSSRDLKAENAASSVTVRPFRESDRDEMAELCRDTCTYPWLQRMAHLLWLYQYLDQEPEACFVGEVEGHVIAYWIGTSAEPLLAEGFRAHVRRYRGEFVRVYLTAIGRTFSVRRHFWFWRIIIGAAIRPCWTFRSYNRRDLLGPILGMTRVHFQVSHTCQSAGIVFGLARAWMDYLATKEVDITCLPGFPGSEQDEAGAAVYWGRIGYHPVRFGNRTLLIAFVRSDASAK